MLVQQNDAFQYVSKPNQIEHFDFDEHCTLEYLKIRFNKKKETEQIRRFLFPKINSKTYNLAFLCVS